MTKEEYQAFIELQSNYEREKEKVEQWITPLLNKIESVRNGTSQRHRASVGDVWFSAEGIHYSLSCCGGSGSSDALNLSDAFSKRFEQGLDEKLNVIYGERAEIAKQQKAEEIKQLKSRLGQLTAKPASGEG